MPGGVVEPKAVSAPAPPPLPGIVKQPARRSALWAAKQPLPERADDRFHLLDPVGPIAADPRHRALLNREQMTLAVRMPAAGLSNAPRHTGR